MFVEILDLNSMENLQPLITLIMGLSFLIFIVFNSSRMSDASSVNIKVMETSISAFEVTSNDEFLIIRGPLQTKNTLYRNLSKKGEITAEPPTPGMIWRQDHKVYFLKSFLLTLKRLKVILADRGLHPADLAFLVNQLNGIGEFATCMLLMYLS